MNGSRARSSPESSCGRSAIAAVALLTTALLALTMGGCAAGQGDRPLDASKPEANDCSTSNWSSRHYARYNRNAVDGFDTLPCYAPATRDIKD